jgi:transposase
MPQTTTPTAGLDIGKLTLDLALTGQPEVTRFSNTPEGHAELIATLRRHGVARLGLEATGGYEAEVYEALAEAGLAVVRFQPAQVRFYAKSRLRRAKTDRLDAHLIAACTAAYDGPVRPARDQRLSALAEPMRLFEQITADIACFKTRCESYRDNDVKADLKAQIKQFGAWRQRVLKQIVTALRAEADLKQRLDLLLSIPGLGERTAVQLLINMPELGRITREEAASLAGLAPFDRSSGQYEGQRHIAGGRAEIRTALYAACLPASYRWNPALVAMRERLNRAGKPFKLVMVACARKLLIFANTVLQRGTPWQAETPAAKPAATAV